MKIAVFGAGLLGSSIVSRLLTNKKNHITVYNRSSKKLTALKTSDCQTTSDSQEAIVSNECVLLLLSDAKAINDVLFPKANFRFKGKTFIQMGTIAPFESMKLAKKVKQSGGEYLECPVLGSRKEALDGKLILMFGSTLKQFKRWKSVLKILGETLYVGEVGKAAVIKLALNNLIGTYAAGYSLSLGLLEKNKVNIETFAKILRQSSLYAPMFDKKLPSWLNRSYKNPNFSSKHLLKDVRLVLGEAQRQKLNVEVICAIERIVAQTCRQGLADVDYSSVFNTINRVKNDSHPKRK